jgi:hypothetical protein
MGSDKASHRPDVRASLMALTHSFLETVPVGAVYPHCHRNVSQVSSIATITLVLSLYSPHHCTAEIGRVTHEIHTTNADTAHCQFAGTTCRVDENPGRALNLITSGSVVIRNSWSYFIL